MGKASTNLAFVLLSEAQLPDPNKIVQAFQQFAAADESIRIVEDGSEIVDHDRIIEFKFGSGERSFVALMPVAVPDHEADEGAQFSLSSFRSGWRLQPHCAHLAVTFQSTTASPPIARLSRFTSLLAAVTKVCPAVGVYWGSAGATHDSKFFLSAAPEQNGFLRLVLWSGISVAREKDGRLSLLSLGMSQLDLPNMMIVAGKSSEKTAFETLFDLLTYVAERGTKLSEGDTVGRTANERLLVRYVRSPIDSTTEVMRVELP